MAFCGSCGKQIPDGSGFCPACGAAAGSGAPQPAASAGGGTAPSAAAAQRARLEAQFKAGSQDAVQAFMVLLRDPVGGLGKSYGMFDQGRALMVGGIFAAVFALVAMLAPLGFGGMMAMGSLGGGGGAIASSSGGAEAAAIAEMARAAREAAREMGASVPGLEGPSTFKIMMKSLGYGLVFAAALIGACVLARILFKGTSQFAGEIYMAGASLLPLAVAVLLGLLLGALGLYQVISWVGIFALVLTILMLNAGCMKILGISDSKASLAVPVILVIAAVAATLVRGSL